MIADIVLAGLGAVGSAWLTWLALAYARRQRLLDHPGPRRSHTQATPRGGGIAPVLMILAGGAWLAATAHPVDRTLLAAVCAIAAVAAVGWIDDHRPLPAWPRLLVHVLAAVGLVLAQRGLPRDALQALESVLAVVLMVGMVNAWNFMDGIDGLASSQALLALAILLAGGWLGGVWWTWCDLALAALAGFLPFNAPRARIFLGDVGSGALGLLVAVLLLHACQRGGMPWPLVLWLPSAFLLDAGATLLQRVYRRERWWRPHRQHLYQWLVRHGRLHSRVSVYYGLWTLAAGVLALWLVGQAPRVVLAVTFAGLACGLCLWLRLRRAVWIKAQGRR